jgi:aconitate hydratase
MPDQVVPISVLAGGKIDQVVIGSCTNSSYRDLAIVAAMLAGRSIHPGTSLVIAPGSRQVLYMLSLTGALSSLVCAGARILECACGPCFGIGQAPPSSGVTLRTVNRNFAGRAGTPDAGIYLSGPEVAAASALSGAFCDPRTLGAPPVIEPVEKFPVLDGLFRFPPEKGDDVQIVRGPNIKPLPEMRPPGKDLEGEVLIKAADNVTTDDILPAGDKIAALRSNIPAIARYVFFRMDPGFADRAQACGGGFIAARENYGQGSSREHAALSPRFLGVRAVLACSFSRIHRANLVNFGILPLLFENPKDWESLEPGDRLSIPDVLQCLNRHFFVVRNLTKGVSINVRIDLNEEEKKIIAAGGKLNRYRLEKFNGR